MSESCSHSRLLDHGSALDTYLDELLSEAPPGAPRVDCSATPGAAPAPDPDALPVQRFQVAGLALAVPLQRVQRLVTGATRLQPCTQGVGPLVGVLAQPGGGCRVVDTAALILPGDAGRVPDANALRHAAQFVVLDEGRWALACDSVTDVTQIKRSAVKWRTVAGRRPWLAGTLMNPMCALLDVDALITLLEGMVAR